MIDYWPNREQFERGHALLTQTEQIAFNEETIYRLLFSQVVKLFSCLS